MASPHLLSRPSQCNRPDGLTRWEHAGHLGIDGVVGNWHGCLHFVPIFEATSRKCHFPTSWNPHNLHLQPSDDGKWTRVGKLLVCTNASDCWLGVSRRIDRAMAVLCRPCQIHPSDRIIGKTDRLKVEQKSIIERYHAARRIDTPWSNPRWLFRQVSW